MELDENQERKKFQNYIFDNWDSSKHNFSMDENGMYVYRVMEDAWDIWLSAKYNLISELGGNYD